MPELPSQILPNIPYTELVFVQGDQFLMGGQSITVSDFAIGKYPVTQELWETIMGKNNNNSLFKDPHRPVESVSWFDAQSFLHQLTTSLILPDDFGYRLPSEAEWEYAARGGNRSHGYEYAGSNDLDKIGWYKQNSHGESKSVGLKLPNELGLHDMTGNVWEWCEDQYHSNLGQVPKDGTAWVDGYEFIYCVLHGGSWLEFARSYRSMFRASAPPMIRRYDVGFRVVFFFPPGSWSVSSQ
jgi:formylglycine-generating enzyme required for sulfatase activity